MVEEERIKEYVKNNMDYLQVFRWDSIEGGVSFSTVLHFSSLLVD